MELMKKLVIQINSANLKKQVDTRMEGIEVGVLVVDMVAVPAENQEKTSIQFI